MDERGIMMDSVLQTTCRRYRGSGGFTLIEMVVSMFIMVLLLAGVTSAIMIAARSVGHGSSGSSSLHEATIAVNRMFDELAYMTTIDTCKPENLLFTVADRDGDSSDDWIEYDWPGVAGDPLLRSFNQGDSSLIVPKAKLVQFDCNYREETYEVEGEDEESEPQLIDSQYTGDDIFENDGRFLFSQYIEPVLADGAISWEPTGVWVKCRNDAGHAAGLMRATIYEAKADRTPKNVPICTGSITLTDWDMNYYYIDFPASRSLEPGVAICLCLTSSVNHVDMALNDDSGTNMARSDNNGQSWKFYSSGSLIYGIVGTILSDGKPVTKTRRYLTDVAITVESENPAEGSVITSVQILNEPFAGES